MSKEKGASNLKVVESNLRHLKKCLVLAKAGRATLRVGCTLSLGS